MQCPHCTIHFHENWIKYPLARSNSTTGWDYQSALCPGCGELTIELNNPVGVWIRVHPAGANRGPVPPEVPKGIAEDYVQACSVLPLSAKASAALSRRCLQNILRAHGYTAPSLAKEVDLLLNEADPTKGIPNSLRQTIDGIRNFGNFSAHPVTDQTTLQIIDVDPHEAEWCLEIIEEMFEHFYVRPQQAAARKAALDAKLKAAGKPPSK